MPAAAVLNRVAMASDPPTIRGTVSVTTHASISGGAQAVTLPTHVAGDLIVVLWDGEDSVAGATFPADFTQIGARGDGGGVAAETAIYAKVAASASETFSVSGLTNTLDMAAHAYVIKNVPSGTASAICEATDAGVTSIDPPNLDPSFASAGVWIAFVGHNNTAAVTATPAGYSGGTISAVANAGVASAYKESVAGSEDPGAFTGGGGNRIAWTIGIKAP